jgi:hypothetical protein
MFAFRLARELGYAHPDHLLSELTATQFYEWQEYFTAEPFGPEVESLRAAVIACTVANSLRSPKSPARKVVDFLIGHREPDIKEQVKAVFEGLKNRGTR